MRKSYLICLALGVCLFGCGKTASSADRTDITDISSDEWGTEEILSEPLSETEICGITIADHKTANSYSAGSDDSVPILKVTASFPSVSIADNEKAAKKITDSVRTELNTFLEFEESNVHYAKEAYLMSLDSSDDPFSMYTANFSYQIKRCDEAILSIVFCQNDYSGGDHANYLNYGMTFDIKTGDRLYLESLSTDYNVFHQLLLKELNHQISLSAYQNFLYPNHSFDLDEIFLTNSECWYLDRSGISFISNPYVLGPYAAGDFEFHIPYEKLTNLKAEYFYNGPYIQKLFPAVSGQYDLNGNKTLDNICYQQNPPHLLINGTDFSTELKNLTLSEQKTNAYYLIDVEPDDAFVEIAILSEDTQTADNCRTHFFRYEKDGRLIYIGNIPELFGEDIQVHYNKNGNLVSYDRNKAPLYK